MKKLSKILLVLVLCIACFSLTACSKSDEKKLVGTWETVVDATQIMGGSESDSESMEKYYPNGLQFTFAFSFDDSKNVALSITDASLNEFKNTIVSGLKAQFIDMLGDSAEEFVTSMGYESLDAYVEETAKEFDIDEIKKQVEKTYKFEAKDGKLFIYENQKDDNDYVTYEFVSDNELKFTEFKTNLVENVPFELPMSLKKTK